LFNSRRPIKGKIGNCDKTCYFYIFGNNEKCTIYNLNYGEYIFISSSKKRLCGWTEGGKEERPGVHFCLKDVGDGFHIIENLEYENHTLYMCSNNYCFGTDDKKFVKKWKILEYEAFPIDLPTIHTGDMDLYVEEQIKK